MHQTIKRRLLGLLGYIFVILIVACGPATSSESPEPPDELESTEPLQVVPELDSGTDAEGVDPDKSNLPTLTPPPLPGGYPGQPTPLPSPNGYPAPVEELPTPEPYPADKTESGSFVWMLLPVGKQCAEPGENNYADLQAAVAALTAAGITIGDAEMTNLPVCSACGCPTSAHFRIQVDGQHLAAAEALGWRQEE